MIRVVRGSEPPALREARWWRLACARETRRNGTLEASAFAGYEGARDLLHVAQERKCAFCEQHLLGAGAPVEHFRPKQRADRIDWGALAAGATQDDLDDFSSELPPANRALVKWVRGAEGYWWLTWSWDNLLLSCTACNTAYKKNCFPLRRGTEAADFEVTAVEQERPLLLDPTRDNPMDHIRFDKVNGHWRPAARCGSLRGAWTIAVLELDSPTHLSFYTHHVRRYEKGLLGELRRAAEVVARTNEPPQLQQLRLAWEALASEVFDPLEEYQGLLWDVMDGIVDEAARTQWGLEHPRPCDYLPAGPPMRELDPPYAATLDPDALWLVRSVYGSAPEQALRDALVTACRCAPRTREELAAMTGREASTLRPHLKALEAEGRLALGADARYGPAAAPSQSP